MIHIGYKHQIIDIIHKYGQDILDSDIFKKELEYIQHGDITTYEHSLAVTYVSVYIALRSHAQVDMKSLVRGALLHDFFLYDWHEKNRFHRFHGYTHATTSIRNAQKHFKLNGTEKSIIYSHMFPLNLTRIPRCREATIVCMADKICATAETITFVKYAEHLSYS